MKVITRKLTDIKAVESPEQRSAFIMVLESGYRFTLGAFAGGKFYIWLNISLKIFFYFFKQILIYFISKGLDIFTRKTY